MIMTPIGCLKIKINDILYLYEYAPLPTRFGNFFVLQRYQIIIPILDPGEQYKFIGGK